MSDETLPGLEVPRRHGSKLLDAVDRTLAQLTADQHIDPNGRDSARVELARSLAQVIDHKRTSGRASTVGQDAKVLLDLLDGMVPTEAASGADLALAAAMAKWSAMVEAQAGK